MRTNCSEIDVIKGLPSQIINNRHHYGNTHMSRLTLVQALIFTVFLVMAISGLWLGFIWQDGMLNPVETQERLDETSQQFGPWAILIDVFIFMPLTWWFTRKYFWREKVIGVLPGLMLDAPTLPAVPPKFVPPIYAQQNDDWAWEDMQMRKGK